MQMAVTLDSSESEPGVSVARGDISDYECKHPSAIDLALVVELASGSLSTDRSMKSRIYARAGIREYWIVILMSRKVEVFTIPSDPGSDPHYTLRCEFGVGELIPIRIDTVDADPIAVELLFPKS